MTASEPRLARVVVNLRGRISDRAFDYAIPADMDVQPGHLVWAPFGSRRVQGIVLETAPATTSEVALDDLRPLEALIDPEPVLAPWGPALVRWLADHYFCSLREAALLLVPGGLRQHGRAVVTLRPLPLLPPLSPLAARVAAYLGSHGPTDEAALRLAFRGERGLGEALSELARSGAADRQWEVAPARARPRRRLFVRLQAPLPGPDPASPRPIRRALATAQRLLAVANRLNVAAASAPLLITATDFRAATGADGGTLRALADQGALTLEEHEVARDPTRRRPALSPGASGTLTPAQSAAVEAISAGIGQGAAFLLHGVTGSGKTEVYLHAAARARAAGLGVFLLVPEIALEPQLATRARARFPGDVALLHSGLGEGERFDEWRRTRDGRAGIVVGARSALFAPMPRPGLIVLDEAHEPAYKQGDPAPRYQARDVARRLAEITGAALVLGSATPDLDTWWAAEQRQLIRLSLPDRVAGPRTGAAPPPMPTAEIVDLREGADAAPGPGAVLSAPLRAALIANLEARGQSLLFLNRRGSATRVQCVACGHVLECPRCVVAYVYHAEPGELRCHQCNRQARVPARCPSCWHTALRYLGAGTERVEAEVAALLPTARVARWDRDTARGAAGHARLLAEAAAGNIDVLVGTQLIARGLDLPRVTLVGIVAAETALYFPDFRAAERTYQLIEQVAGRAGRGAAPGRVIVQTYRPDHPAIRAAAAHDWQGFVTDELDFRRQHRYPPFTDLARLLYSHGRADVARATVEREAGRMRAAFTAHGLADVDLIGPAPAFRQQVGGRHRWHLILRGDNVRTALRTIGLPPLGEPGQAGRPHHGGGWQLDLDPVDLL